MNLSAFFKLSYGVYIISSCMENRFNGQIANAVFQVSSSPPKLAVSINKENLTHQFVQKSGVFSVSVLSIDAPIDFIGRFGFRTGRDFNKFEGVDYKIGYRGVPIVLDYTIAYFELELEKQVDLGSHNLFIAKIVGAEVILEGEPLLYSYYHKVKKGQSPKSAPTYVEQEKGGVEGMKQFRCKVCSYVYNPEVGDPENGINPGTVFEDLPDDWVCPVCGVGKDQFEEI